MDRSDILNTTSTYLDRISLRIMKMVSKLIDLLDPYIQEKTRLGCSLQKNLFQEKNRLNTKKFLLLKLQRRFESKISIYSIKMLGNMLTQEKQNNPSKGLKKNTLSKKV